ncbi:MAG TPA: hypothetical protein VK681_12520 [Reyranella sp.]|jgi:hypothetical protein|nr:hypothetical protein [Reyranella sp.]
MSIIRALRSLLSIVASSVGALAIGVAAVAVVVFLLMFAIGLWSPYACTTTVHQRITGLSGFDFEISETDCDVLAKDAATSVFVSEAGQKKKSLLFKYVPPGYDAIPSITPIDEHTVQISIRRVPQILCRKDRWQALAIRYVIEVIEYPGRNGKPDEC